MALTIRRRARDPDAFPTGQLFLLAIVRLAEPIALTSIFPYAWALIKSFHIGNQDDSSFYAGLLISSFSLAEALMGMFWGGISDRVGRKPVLLLGCVGTMLSMIMVGFASNIWVALAGRALGGLLNGNIGVIQTMVGELVTKPEHEPRAYSIMPFVWSVGTIVGPAIGGTFANPHESFPHLFPANSFFATFPFLLPNLICAALLFASIILGYLLLEGTHPDMQPRILPPDTTFVSEETPLMETSDAIKRPAVDYRDENYGALTTRHGEPSNVIGRTRQTKLVLSQSVFSQQIMTIVLSLSIFTYHSMTYDHLLPIFFEDARIVDRSPSLASLHLESGLLSPGGLGLSVRAVGGIMAINGFMALFIQAVIFPLAAERMGVYRLFMLVTLLHPIAYAIMPLLLSVPQSILYPAIYVCLFARNICAILLYPLLLILLKEATPSPTVLGKVNGLAASAGAACRMVAPPISGHLYTIGKRMDCTALAWYASTLIAAVGALQSFSVKRARASGTLDDETRPSTPVIPGRHLSDDNSTLSAHE